MGRWPSSSTVSIYEAVLPACKRLQRASRQLWLAKTRRIYPVVGGALLWTPRKGLGESWTPDVAAAWTAAYGTLSGYMVTWKPTAAPEAAEDEIP